MSSIKTIFGTFSAEAKKRLDLTFDYETCAIKSFKRIAKEIGATSFIDIGANIGVYSVYLSNLDGIQSVHSFEPAPEAFQLLQENIALQKNAEKIKTHQIALSNQDGDVNFHIVSPLSGANGVVEAAGRDTMVVKAKRLDNYLDLKDQTVVIKIDVEGHEVALLEGARNFLSRNKAYVQIESLRPELVSGMRRILAEVGYSYVFSLQNDHLFLHPDLNSQTQAALKIISEELAHDLHDLTELRIGKRILARDARKLYHNAGYVKDPLLA